MGKINQGILGGFRGKVGNVVGFFWKGQAVMRALAGSVHNPRTTAQMSHRAHFALAGSYSAMFSDFIATFYSPRYRRSSVSRPASSVNMFTRNVFRLIQPSENDTTTPSGWAVDPVAVKMVDRFGEYAVQNPTNISVTSPSARNITLSWTDNSGSNIDTNSNDVIYFVVVPTGVRDERGLYPANLKAYLVDTAQRRDASLNIVAPYTVDQVQSYDVYVFASNSDLSGISDSLYIGQVNVASA